jgi:hypothetical protein
MNSLFVLFTFILFVLGLAYCIRNRIKIASWLKASDVCAPEPPDRTECLKRHITRKNWELQAIQWRIEDAQRELVSLETKEQKGDKK